MALALLCGTAKGAREKNKALALGGQTHLDVHLKGALPQGPPDHAIACREHDRHKHRPNAKGHQVLEPGHLLVDLGSAAQPSSVRAS